MEEELRGLLVARGLGEDLASALARYGALLLSAGAQLNLTGAKTAEQLAEHIEDSLTLAPYAADPLVDIGSGGGLPAIPIAIAAGTSVTLVESSAKKARFLDASLAVLGLKGEVLSIRAEDAARDGRLREAFASGTCRAVGAAPTAAEFVLPFLRLGGVALLQRGDMTAEETADLSDAALVLGGELEQVLTVGEKRTLAVVRKKEVTPPRFPRRTGVPAKRPLCQGVSRETKKR